MPNRWIKTLATVATLASCGASSVAAAPAIGKWGYDLTAIDRQIRPGDDFFSFANGDWVKRTAIPADRSSTGSFADVRYAAGNRVRTLIEAAAASPADPATPQGKIAALYRAYLDADTVEARGAAPLRAALAEIGTARNRSALAALMGRGASSFYASIFALEIAYDPTDPRRYAVRLGQGGLGLPDRDYYLEPQFAESLTAYHAYVAQLLRLIGWPDADAQADAVVAFEARIAKASWAASKVRDPQLNADPETIAALARRAPRFPWKPFMAGAGLGHIDRVIDVTDTSLSPIAAIYAGTPLPVLKAWQAFRTADAAAPYLSHRFAEAQFAFRGHVVAGIGEPPPRWRAGVDLVSDTLGSAVGKLYVERFFSPAAKAAADTLIVNLFKALRTRIAALSWMEPATKAAALRKLATQHVQIGYPDHWRDYRRLDLRADDLFGDVLRSRAFEWQRQVALIGKPWDASAWRFWPEYPTAYGENRDLIFTAAMFQPPFFDAAADPAINYGAIGAVIGHELSHLFDDRGRQEDEDAKRRNWWTPVDAARFEDGVRRLRAQYSEFAPLPGLHIRGDVTIGENLADLGGVAIALEAYHDALGGRPAPVLDGLTGDQRVFLGWAQAWRDKIRPDALRRQIASDLHSPPTARVNGVVRNLDEWYAAFGVKPGDALYLPPGERVRIW